MDQQLRTPTQAPAVAPANRATRPPRSRLGLMALILLAIVAGIVWWTRQESAPQEGNARKGAAAPMSIVPETVGKGDIGVNLNALGTVTSLGTVTIKSQISGYLTRVVFKEGDEVKKGDLIAEIELASL